MMPPFVVITGAQNSGKTKLVARLVRHFVKQGLRVGTIKHAGHGFDVPKKDSHAHFHAGATVTVLASADQTAVFCRQRLPSLGRLVAQHCVDVDLVLVEGFRRERAPRIEVYRRAATRVPLPGRLTALVTDDPIHFDGPRFRTRELTRLGRFIRELCGV